MDYIVVESDKLASVLIVDKSLEEYPEPYRACDDISLVVTLDNYLEFIGRYLDTDNYMATDTMLLRFWLQENDTTSLTRAYYKDMSYALMKELWYSDSPTAIYHEVRETPTLGYKYLDVLSTSFMREYNSAQKNLLSGMKQRGYAYTPAKLVKHQKQLTYATALYAMSQGVSYSEWTLERGALDAGDVD